MKVLDIVLEQEAPQINSLEDLKSAFEPNEWYNIVVFLNYNDLQREFTRSAREERIYQIINRFGPQSTYRDPSSWARYARSFNMSPPQYNVTWQDIYNFLAPHKDKNVDVGGADRDPAGPDVPRDSYDAIIRGFFDTPTEFRNSAELERYATSVLEKLRYELNDTAHTKKPEESNVSYFNQILAQNEPGQEPPPAGQAPNNRWTVSWNTVVLRNPNWEFPVSKTQVDNAIIGWHRPLIDAVVAYIQGGAAGGDSSSSAKPDLD